VLKLDAEFVLVVEFIRRHLKVWYCLSGLVLQKAFLVMHDIVAAASWGLNLRILRKDGAWTITDLSKRSPLRLAELWSRLTTA